MAEVSRAGRRAATRQALVDATVQRLRSDGVAAVTTRQIARAVDVAQSTVMYHFRTRENLLAAASTQLAFELADQAREHYEEAAEDRSIDLADFLDLIWREITTPQALSVAQLWMACWTDAQFIDTVRSLEQHLFELGIEGMGTLASQLDPGVSAREYLDTVMSVVRGLIMSIPVWGIDIVNVRWAASKSNLLRAAQVPVL